MIYCQGQIKLPCQTTMSIINDIFGILKQYVRASKLIASHSFKNQGESVAIVEQILFMSMISHLKKKKKINKIYSEAFHTYSDSVIRLIVCNGLKEWNGPAERLRWSEQLQPSIKWSASELMHESQPNTVLFLGSAASTFGQKRQKRPVGCAAHVRQLCLVIVITNVFIQLFFLSHSRENQKHHKDRLRVILCSKWGYIKADILGKQQAHKLAHYIYHVSWKIKPQSKNLLAHQHYAILMH